MLHVKYTLHVKNMLHLKFSKKLTKFLTQKNSQNVNKNVKNILLISYK